MVIKLNNQLQSKETGWNEFLVAQTTVKRRENKSKKQRLTNKKS